MIQIFSTFKSQGYHICDKIIFSVRQRVNGLTGLVAMCQILQLLCCIPCIDCLLNYFFNDQRLTRKMRKEIEIAHMRNLEESGIIPTLTNKKYRPINEISQGIQLKI